MGRLLSLGAGILLGGVLMYLSFTYHIVVTEQTYYFVPKKQIQLTEVYVDIRTWDAQEWTRHPRLAEAMIAAGHGELVKQSVQDGLLEQLSRKIGVREQTRK